MEVNGCKFIVGEATQNCDRHYGLTPASGVTMVHQCKTSGYGTSVIAREAAPCIHIYMY